MKDNKNTWLAGGVQAAVALLLAYLAAKARGLNGAADAAWICRYLSDGFFVSALLHCGFGLLIWVSTTGFFDIMSYGFSSLLVLFTGWKNPKEHKQFYDYKCEKEAKREGKGWPKMTLVIGLICLDLSVLMLFLYYQLGGK